jgi:hypothetical protein
MRHLWLLGSKKNDGPLVATLRVCVVDRPGWQWWWWQNDPRDDGGAFAQHLRGHGIMVRTRRGTICEWFVGMAWDERPTQGIGKLRWQSSWRSSAIVGGTDYIIPGMPRASQNQPLISPSWWLGEIQCCTPHGWGMSTASHRGGWCRGQWLNGAIDHGVMIVPRKYVFSGQFQDGRFHGTGTLTLASGVEYDGDWLHGLPDGHGTMVTASVTSVQDIMRMRPKSSTSRAVASINLVGHYQGRWRDGRRQGSGTHTWPDGSCYVGSWQFDLPNGHGTLKSHDGSTYSGWMAHEPAQRSRSLYRAGRLHL